MIRIKVYKLSQIICAAVIGILVIIAVIVGISLFTRGSGDPQLTTTMAQTASAQVDVSAKQDKLWLSQLAKKLNLLDPQTVLAAQLPLEPEAIPVTAENEDEDEPDDLDRIRVEISKIEGIYEPKIDGDKPRVLIYHTHSYEAYAQDSSNPYQETSTWRTKDVDFNIMGVGNKLAQELEALGIEVVHDMTEHEPPKLGTAYVRSLKTLQTYADANEEFDMMIDLHRDAASTRNTNPSYVTDNNKQYARLMMLIGSNDNNDGSDPSAGHNWKENYKLADALTQNLNGRVANICRDVMVKTGRYNQHMSPSAILVEVGHNKNTLEQALNATEPLAQSIADILLGDS